VGAFDSAYAAKVDASQIIQRAGDFPAHGPRQLGVDFRRAHIRMAEQLLDAASRAAAASRETDSRQAARRGT